MYINGKLILELTKTQAVVLAAYYTVGVVTVSVLSAKAGYWIVDKAYESLEKRRERKFQKEEA